MSAPVESIPEEGTPSPASPELPAAPAADRAAILADLDSVNSDLADKLEVFANVPFETCSQALVDEFNVTLGELHKRARAVIVSATPFSREAEFAEAFKAVRGFAPRFEGFLMRLRVRNDALLQAATVPSAPALDPSERPTPVYLVTDDEIPKFSGDPKAWKSWWNLYSNAIHKNEHVSLTQKFKTLTKSLTGDARALIGQPAWDHVSYRNAIEKLRDEYAPSRGAAKRLFHAIKETIPPRNNGEDLRDFVTRFRTSVTEYEDTADTVLPDMTICQLLDDLVPGEIRTALYLRTHSYDIPAERYYNELRNISEVHIVSNNVKTFSHCKAPSHQDSHEAPQANSSDQQASSTFTAHQASRPRDTRHRNHQNNHQNNGRSFHQQRCNGSDHVNAPNVSNRSAPMAPFNRQNPPQQRAPPAAPSALLPRPPRGPIRNRNFDSSCRFCRGNHYPSACPAYPDANSRVKRLQEQNRCVNCFQPPHGTDPCPNTSPCGTCGGLHKYPVCPVARFRLDGPPVNVNQALLPNPYDTHVTHQGAVVDPNTFYASAPVSADQATGQLIDNYHAQAQNQIPPSN